MGRKIPEDECPKGLPGWLATFGDLMSLLLTFFVLLLSFSTINVIDFQNAMGALQGALGVLYGQPEMSLPIRRSLPRSEGNLARATTISKTSQELQQAIEEAGLQGDVQIEESSSGVIIRVADKLFFDLGEAGLKAGAVPLMEKLGGVLKGVSNHINVQGHTDDLPINTEAYASNWELSGMRALSVARYFIRQVGLSPDRVSITGYSQYQPLVPNDTPENRLRNRRVEIHVLYDTDQGASPAEVYRLMEKENIGIEGRKE